MKRKLAGVLPIVFLLLLTSTIVGVASAQTTAGVPGVSVGDTFLYDGYYYWNSTNPADTPPASLSSNNASRLIVIITAVSGANVTLQETWTFQNGTSTAPYISHAEVDIPAEQNDPLVYAANLNVGDPLFPGISTYPYTVSETVYRSYGEGARETNHVKANNTAIEGTLYSYLDLYFDKQTGMAVEYSWTNVYSDTPNQALTQHIVLNDTDAWTILHPVASSSPEETLSPSVSASPSGTNSPISTTLIITIIVAIGIVVVVALLVLVPKKKHTQPTEPASQPSEAPP
jgi:hypothetical protein